LSNKISEKMDLKYIAERVSEMLLNIGAQIQEEQARQELGARISDSELENRFQKLYEKKIKHYLIDEFPEIAFEGEDTHVRNTEKEWIWVCDPLDGKWSFWNGEATWATTISLLHKGETVFSAINNPMMQQLFVQIDGYEPTVNDKIMPIHIKREPSNLVVNFMMDRKQTQKIQNLMELRAQGILDKVISTGGSLSYALALIAEGRHSSLIVVKDQETDFWDQGGAIHILTESGGKITDLQGKPFKTTIPTTGFIASSSTLVHHHILPIIQKLGW